MADYTYRQGQYLAYIYLHGGRGHVEIALYFRFAGRLAVEKKKLIARTPGAPRSIRVLVPKDQLPELA